jgi:hypothetical protein
MQAFDYLSWVEIIKFGNRWVYALSILANAIVGLKIIQRRVFLQSFLDGQWQGQLASADDKIVLKCDLFLAKNGGGIEGSLYYWGTGSDGHEVEGFDKIENQTFGRTLLLPFADKSFTIISTRQIHIFTTRDGDGNGISRLARNYKFSVKAIRNIFSSRMQLATVITSTIAKSEGTHLTGEFFRIF